MAGDLRKGFIKTFIEDLLKEELVDKAGAHWYERTRRRPGYRNAVTGGVF